MGIMHCLQVRSGRRLKWRLVYVYHVLMDHTLDNGCGLLSVSVVLILLVEERWVTYTLAELW